MLLESKTVIQVSQCRGCQNQ